MKYSIISYIFPLYRGITLIVDGLNRVQMRRSQEAGGCQTMIKPGATGSSVSLESISWRYDAVERTST